MRLNQIKITWNSNLAYAIGLITSDGCLSSGSNQIWFSSSEKDMVDNYKKSLGLSSKIGRYARGGEKEKRYFYIQFKNKTFYKFLLSLGLAPAKSKIIKKVMVPNKYFHDFLRGLFDGDGSFYSFRDTRWPSSFGYQISFASASMIFLKWLKGKLTNLYGVKGFIRPGAGVFVIRYVKNDSIKIFLAMYSKENSLFLKSKHDKIISVLHKDNLFKNNYAGVA